MFRKTRRPQVRNRQKTRNGQVNQYASLEPRQLLAAFNGTAGADVVTVNFVGGAPVSVVINGTNFANPDPTMQISMGGNAGDILNLRGTTFNVTGALNNAAGTGSGMANGVLSFDFSDALKITTEGGHDSFDLAGVANMEFTDVSFLVDTGAGNDTFRFSGYGFQEVRLGDGVDRLISTDSSLIDNFDAGAGFDTWQSESAEFEVPLLMIDASGYVFGRSPAGGNLYSSQMHGLEKATGLNPNSMSGVQNQLTRATAPINNLFYGIDGTTSQIFHGASGKIFQMVNFNHFEGEFSATQNTNNLIKVRETAFDVTVHNGGKVVLGGIVNFGNTIFLQHNVQVTGDTNELIISDSDNPDGHAIHYGLNSVGAGSSVYSVSGMSPKPILFSDKVRNVTLLGTNGANPDRFYISANQARLSLYGNAGDDVFVIGSISGGSARDLNRMTGTVNIVGGDGNDYIRADDSDATGSYSYRLRDNWIHNSPDPTGTPNRAFAGIWHTGAERVNIVGTAQTNRFRVTPSMTIRYVINGSPVNGTNDDDRLMLIVPVPSQRSFIFTGPEAGTWYFGDSSGNDDNTAKTIHFLEIENNDGLAV